MRAKIWVPLLIAIILIIDQASKVWVKTNMFLGQEYRYIGDWARIHFTENPGMAFGMEFAGIYGKLILTSFRIFAVAFIVYLVIGLIKKKANWGLLTAVALIFAGAVGNIIDSIFYGVIFEHSSPHLQNIATMFPEGGGYSGWLHGKVVDMFYFPMFSFYMPEFIPYFGGEFYTFFRYIFNVADSSIFIGVCILILFNKKFFPSGKLSDAF